VARQVARGDTERDSGKEIDFDGRRLGSFARLAKRTQLACRPSLVKRNTKLLLKRIVSILKRNSILSTVLREPLVPPPCGKLAAAAAQKEQREPLS
jgi:hypothetical protein